MENKDVFADIDVEATIFNIVDRVACSRFNSLEEKKLRSKIVTDPGFLLEAAKFVGTEVVYFSKEISVNNIAKIINNSEGLYEGDLRYYYKFIFYAPNANNPYHNFRHMIHVMCSVYEAAKFEGLTPREFRGLLLGGLVHDYAHSGQMGNDHQEILTTIKMLEEFILDEDKYLLPKIEEWLWATEFPYTSESVSKEAGMLRDADASQAFSDAWLQQTVFGLAKESNIPAFVCLEREIEYLQNLNFYSNWGREFLYPKVSKKIFEVKELLDLLN